MSLSAPNALTRGLSSQILFTPALQHEQRPRARPRRFACQKTTPDVLCGAVVERRLTRVVPQQRIFDDVPHLSAQPALEGQRESALRPLHNFWGQIDAKAGQQQALRRPSLQLLFSRNAEASFNQRLI